MNGPYTRVYQEEEVLKAQIPQREKDFWIQLLDNMYNRQGTPEEFAIDIYTKCMENNGYINLVDKI